MTAEMRAILAALRGKRFPLEDEKATQARMFDQLIAAFPEVCSREVAIEGGIIDFCIASETAAGRVGIEVKIQGQPAAIVRQLKGYAADPSIAGLILATAKPVTLPGMMLGKPVAVLDLGRAWL